MDEACEVRKHWMMGAMDGDGNDCVGKHEQLTGPLKLHELSYSEAVVDLALVLIALAVCLRHGLTFQQLSQGRAYRW